MRQITQALSEEVHRLNSGIPIVFMAEVEVPTDPPTRYRMTTHSADVDFGQDSLGADITYSRFPVLFDSIKVDAEGAIPIVRFTIGNSDPELPELLYTHRGLTGRPVVLRFILLSETDTPSAQIRFDGKIRLIQVQEEAVQASVSVSNLYDRQMPSRRYQAKRCRVRTFGDSECGYDTQNGIANFFTCNRSLEDCEARGADELANGLQVKHPARFNAERGLSRTRR